MTIPIAAVPAVQEPGRVPIGVTVRLLPRAASAAPVAAELLAIGDATCTVRTFGGRRERRLRHGDLCPCVDPAVVGSAVSTAPGWEWASWSIAQHLAYREITVSHAAVACAAGPLVIVACGGRKQLRPVPAAELYVGSFHAACRRAAARLTAASGCTLILSARHGLLSLDPAEVVAPYEQRLNQPGAITPEQLRVQALQRQVLSVEDVVVLAGRAYVALARQVWPNARDPLRGSRGIGEQRSRLASIRSDGL